MRQLIELSLPIPWIRESESESELSTARRRLLLWCTKDIEPKPHMKLELQSSLLQASDWFQTISSHLFLHSFGLWGSVSLRFLQSRQVSRSQAPDKLLKLSRTDLATRLGHRESEKIDPKPPFFLTGLKSAAVKGKPWIPNSKIDYQYRNNQHQIQHTNWRLHNTTEGNRKPPISFLSNLHRMKQKSTAEKMDPTKTQKGKEIDLSINST